MATQTRRSGGAVPQAEPNDGGAAGDTEQAQAGRGATTGRQLPRERTEPSGRLEDKTCLLYGQPKVGKSTLASQWGEVFFFNTEGGLGELSVFQANIPDWPTFLEWCAAIAEEPSRYRAVCVDTVDVLALFCSQYTNGQLGIVHESDADFGKGWQAARVELLRPLAKLAAIPGLGLILISHAETREIKTRREVYDRTQPTLSGKIRDMIVGFADLILYVDFDNDDRIIRTKATQYIEAGDRSGRLPEEIRWPVGTNGFKTLQEAWGAVRQQGR